MIKYCLGQIIPHSYINRVRTLRKGKANFQSVTEFLQSYSTLPDVEIPFQRLK